MPVIILPRPTAVRCGPNPFVAGVRPLAAFSGDDTRSFLGRSTNGRLSCSTDGREQESVPLASSHNSIANDEARIVDCFRSPKDLEAGRGKIRDRVEIDHLTVRVKERTDGAVHFRESNNLSESVAP